ncbi:hypothetical protein [Methylobacterium sp. CM6246]
MEVADRDKALFEWLKIENDMVNKQIGAWSEADQKIVAVMATIVAAIVGLSSSQYIQKSGNTPVYMTLLASFLMSIAFIQSSLYSSLILLALERKVDLSKKLGTFLKVDADFALTAYKPDETGPYESYKVGVVPYLAFRATIGSIICIGGLFYANPASYDTRLWICIIIAIIVSSTAFYVTIHHAKAFFQYYQTLGTRPKPPRAEDAVQDEAAILRSYRDNLGLLTWLRDAPSMPKRRLPGQRTGDE